MPPGRLVAVLGVGVLVDPDAPVVAADDLGLTRGDGCFDATRLVVDGDGTARLDHLDAHLRRFARSADVLGIGPIDEVAWRELIDEAVTTWQRAGEAVLRVMLTRGREQAPGAPVTGVLTIASLDAAVLEARRGIAVATIARGHAADAFVDVPWLLGGVKSLSYAVNVAASREAARRGVGDVVFVSSDGYALEAPRAALVWRIAERLCTTPQDRTGVLASITQAAVFSGAARDGVEVSYELITARALVGADGVWLASSGRGIVPVHTLDGDDVGADPAWTSSVREWSERPMS